MNYGMGSSLTGHSSSSSDYNDYNYDIIPLPDGLKVGIMDSPFYDCKTKSLYFVDLFMTNIFRYSEESNQIYYCSIPGYTSPSFFIPARGKEGIYAMGVNQSVYSVQWDGVSNTCNVVGKIATGDTDTSHHTNTAIAGPKGSLYFGYFSTNLCGK